SGTSYLYMDLRRNGAPYNGTLQVRVTDIGATNMVFQINQEYNETISDYEVKSTSLLVKKITPSEMKKAAPGFELSLVFITLVISSVFASRKRRNR
ncbi:MAG: Heimdall-CTERM domain-containing surface protein, partial [Candidatus Hodarchaeales archaeon]